MAPKQSTKARLENAEAGLNEAMREVTTRLDTPGMAGGERLRLLQRQAELGDLRDDLEIRRRRLAHP